MLHEHVMRKKDVEIRKLRLQLKARDRLIQQQAELLRKHNLEDQVDYDAVAAVDEELTLEDDETSCSVDYPLDQLLSRGEKGQWATKNEQQGGALTGRSIPGVVLPPLSFPRNSSEGYTATSETESISVYSEVYKSGSARNNVPKVPEPTVKEMKKPLSPINHPDRERKLSTGEAWVEKTQKDEQTISSSEQRAQSHRTVTNTGYEKHSRDRSGRRAHYSPLRRRARPKQPKQSRLTNDNALLKLKEVNKESESEKALDAMKEGSTVQSLESLSIDDAEVASRPSSSDAIQDADQNVQQNSNLNRILQHNPKNKFAAQASAAVQVATEAAQNATHVANVSREKLMQRREARKALEEQGQLSPSQPEQLNKNWKPYEQKRALIQQEMNRRSRSVSPSPYSSDQSQQSALPKKSRTGMAKNQNQQSEVVAKKASLESRIEQIQGIYEEARNVKPNANAQRSGRKMQHNGHIPRRPRAVNNKDSERTTYDHDSLDQHDPSSNNPLIAGWPGGDGNGKAKENTMYDNGNVQGDSPDDASDTLETSALSV